MTELFGALQQAGPVAAEIADPAWLQALLDVEVGLGFALAACGLVAPEMAEQLARHGSAAAYSAAELGAASAATGNPAGPLVAELRRRVGEPAAGAVHLGATSQDALDSASMLVAARATDALRLELSGVRQALADLAAEHVNTVQAGRTLLQQAAPTTFGLVAAGWLAGLARADDALAAARAELAVQYGGAVGTLAAVGSEGPLVVAALARRLGLAEPLLPWHTERSRVAGLAGALGQTAGTVAAVARSITLLAQSEVGELAEVGPAGTGGSSTLPHKHNPVAAILSLACAGQAPGLVGTVLAAMTQEYQRAAGGWHAEWRPLRELLGCTGSAVHWLRTSLDRLQVDTDRMAVTVAAAAGPLTAERVAGVLLPYLGRAAAVAVAAESAGAADPVAALAADPRVVAVLRAEEIRDLVEPSAYVGAAGVFVARVLADHQRREHPG